MGLVIVSLLQAASSLQPSTAPNILPSIEIHAQARIDSVEIESEGPVVVEFTGDLAEGTGENTRRSIPAGAQSYRDLTIRYHGQLMLADPLEQAWRVDDQTDNQSNATRD
ncbi:MAG: hypothetical protein EX262_02630 [Sphingomonadaceae bacterium]|nr:MAG: hypothetical protein EX262_02630 [Sphingomonadaceae bacterium]